MHELSIIQGVVLACTEALAKERFKRVLSVRMRVGALSGVVEDALRFSYSIATEGTPLAGSQLEVQRLPVVIHCPRCAADVELPGVQRFRCPHCGTLSGDIRQGLELEIESMEIEEIEEMP